MVIPHQTYGTSRPSVLPTEFILASDERKSSQSDACDAKSQSVHIFRLPTTTES
jgi:hypothetical protein